MRFGDVNDGPTLSAMYEIPSMWWIVNYLLTIKLDYVMHINECSYSTITAQAEQGARQVGQYK
jgi:hypothetical protein